MEVVRKIGSTATDPSDRPIEDIVIEKVTMKAAT